MHLVYKNAFGLILPFLFASTLQTFLCTQQCNTNNMCPVQEFEEKHVQQLNIFSWHDVNVKDTVKPFFTSWIIFVLSGL